MSKERQIEMEYSTLMAQYRAARDEIDGLLGASRQIVNLAFTVISLFLGVLTFTEARLPVIYLILPFFLYAVVWVQLRHILLMRRASAYISESIAPRVREIINQSYAQKKFQTNHILNWENEWKSPGQGKDIIFLLPVLGAGYGVPLFAAVLSLIGYVYISPVSTISYGEWILIIVNLIALFYSITLGFLIEFRHFGQKFVNTGQ